MADLQPRQDKAVQPDADEVPTYQDDPEQLEMDRKYWKQRNLAVTERRRRQKLAMYGSADVNQSKSRRKEKGADISAAVQRPITPNWRWRKFEDSEEHKHRKKINLSEPPKNIETLQSMAKPLHRTPKFVREYRSTAFKMTADVPEPKNMEWIQANSNALRPRGKFKPRPVRDMRAKPVAAADLPAPPNTEWIANHSKPLRPRKKYVPREEQHYFRIK